MAQVVDLKDGQCMWLPVNTTTVITDGEIVGCGSDDANAGDGVVNITAAAGASDTTGKTVPIGVVVGNNDVVKSLNSSGAIDNNNGATSVTGVESQALQVARNHFGQEGMFSKGDTQALVQVAEVTPETWIEIPIYNAAWGTAPTVLTSTTTSADGLGFTTGAMDFTGVADYQTFYCRTGANAGLYRISETTSTTVHTFQIAWPYDVAIGDTFVAVPMRIGGGRLQTDALASYCDCSATPGTDYYTVITKALDLRYAGQEKAVFKFSVEQFTPKRA